MRSNARIQDVLNQSYRSLKIENPPTLVTPTLLLLYPTLLTELTAQLLPKHKNPTQNTLVGNTFHNSHSNKSNTHRTNSRTSLPSFCKNPCLHTYIHSSQKKRKIHAPSRVSPLEAEENSRAFSVVKTSPPNLFIADSNESLVRVEGS